MPSALIAALGLSDSVRAANPNFLAALWQVADEMSPRAKLMIGGLLIIAFLFGALGRLKTLLAAWLIWNALLGAAVMAAVLLLIPRDWSRGFGTALSATQDPLLIPIYVLGGLAAGTIFTLACRGCARARAKDAA